MITINRAEGKAWTGPEWAGQTREIVWAVAALAIYGVVSLIHIWAGVYPFPG